MPAAGRTALKASLSPDSGQRGEQLTVQIPEDPEDSQIDKPEERYSQGWVVTAGWLVTFLCHLVAPADTSLSEKLLGNPTLSQSD